MLNLKKDTISFQLPVSFLNRLSPTHKLILHKQQQHTKKDNNSKRGRALNSDNSYNNTGKFTLSILENDDRNGKNNVKSSLDDNTNTTAALHEYPLKQLNNNKDTKNKNSFAAQLSSSSVYYQSNDNINNDIQHKRKRLHYEGKPILQLHLDHIHTADTTTTGTTAVTKNTNNVYNNNLTTITTTAQQQKQQLEKEKINAIGKKTRHLSIQERNKRKEIKRLDDNNNDNNNIDTSMKDYNNKKNSKTFSGMKEEHKQKSKKRKIIKRNTTRLNHNNMIIDNYQDNNMITTKNGNKSNDKSNDNIVVDTWYPDVTHILLSINNNNRSNTVQLHGLPTHCKPEHVKLFFNGLDIDKIFMLPPLDHTIRLSNLDIDDQTNTVTTTTSKRLQKKQQCCIMQREPPNLRVFVKFPSIPIANNAITRSGECIISCTDGNNHSTIQKVAIAITPVAKHIAFFFNKILCIDTTTTTTTTHTNNNKISESLSFKDIILNIITTNKLSKYVRILLWSATIISNPNILVQHEMNVDDNDSNDNSDSSSFPQELWNTIQRLKSIISNMQQNRKIVHSPTVIMSTVEKNQIIQKSIKDYNYLLHMHEELEKSISSPILLHTYDLTSGNNNNMNIDMSIQLLTTNASNWLLDKIDEVGRSIRLLRCTTAR